MFLRSLAGAFGTLLFIVAFASAADISWPEKSGPTSDGHVAEADAVGLPTTWDEPSGKNIAWKIALEGEGHSTPVIGDGKLWFTAANEDGKQQYIYCVSADDGRVIHHKLLFENESPEPLGNPINSYASPSCVLEADALYVHFGTYGTARLNPQTAEIVWQRRDINVRHYRGPGSSPVVFENLLILTFDGIDRQFITALDKTTGKTVWETPRSHDYKDLNEQGKPKGDGDYRKAYHTPTVAAVAGRPVLFSVASKAAFGLDPYTGKELWVFEHENMNAAPRTLFLPGMAIINSGSERANLYGVKLDETTQGNITESHKLWHRKKANAALSSPVLIGERLFFITNQGVCYSVDGRSGEEIYAQRIGGAFCASPIVAGNLIYFTDEAGVTTVVRAASEFEEVAVNHLDDGMRASPAAAKGAIYMRTFKHLYKIAEKK
jgi:outer membrane protein assembly factor BamB